MKYLTSINIFFSSTTGNAFSYKKIKLQKSQFLPLPTLKD